MNKTVHRIKLQYPPKTNLCRSCRYAYGDRRRGLMCEITGKKPDFYAFCPYFTLSVSRDRAAHQYDTVGSENRTRLVKLWSFMLIFIVLLSPLLAMIGRASVFIIIILLLLGFSIYTKLMARQTRNLPLFAYVYTVSAVFIGRSKKLSDNDIQIIYQTLVRFYGNNVAQKALDLMNNGLDMEMHHLRRLVKFLTRWDRRLIYTLLFQLFVYDNVQALYQKNNIMWQLADVFDITLDEYLRLKEIYIAKEHEHKYREQKEWTASSESDILHQYQILGLSPSSTNDEVKRRFRHLAKMYHPDRQPNADMAAQAQEHFRLILAAYQKIKKERGMI